MLGDNWLMLLVFVGCNWQLTDWRLLHDSTHCRPALYSNNVYFKVLLDSGIFGIMQMFQSDVVSWHRLFLFSWNFVGFVLKSFRLPRRQELLRCSMCNGGKGSTQCSWKTLQYKKEKTFQFSTFWIRRFLWGFNSQPPDHQLAFITIIVKCQLWVGDTKTLSVEFSNTWLVLVYFS